MKYSLLLLINLCSLLGMAQEEKRLAFPEIDSLYKEDQLYIGITFNAIGDRPAGITQSGFSGGLHFGAIRDIPFNKRRNFGMGIGLGYSLNTYNHNLIVIPAEAANENTRFSAITDQNAIDSSRFTTHLVEMPVEFRWRTSTPESYKFWRIYAGVRLGYMHYFKSTFKNVDGVAFKEKKPDGLERLRLGTTVSFGWNTFNFHIYYSLNSFFDKSVQIENQLGGFSVVKLGLLFYIL
ncbi:porin family protein [Aquimarina agarilytica]|uniref:porin family protein n=1 Tax=Aquimarina agarilytica TaxID=1087449 RepID=UPI000288515E|nr:porin family protein [Aquimarina agarilytica]